MHNNHTVLQKTFSKEAIFAYNPAFSNFRWQAVLDLLSANSTKGSNTLKQFVGCCRRIIWVGLTILWGWYLKGQLFNALQA